MVNQKFSNPEKIDVHALKNGSLEPLATANPEQPVLGDAP